MEYPYGIWYVASTSIMLHHHYHRDIGYLIKYLIGSGVCHMSAYAMEKKNLFCNLSLYSLSHLSILKFSVHLEATSSSNM